MAPQPSPEKPDFGTFEPVFQSAHGYLALLNLSSGDEAEAVELVRRCCQNVPHPDPEICKLLADSNWCRHLVAAVAAILVKPDRDVVKSLWHRMDLGSWVSPQIGVALHIVDPDFEAESRRRLEAGCPLDISELASMTALERHVVAGPAGSVERSAKNASTLLQLLKMKTPIPAWVQELADSGGIRMLVAMDTDASAVIAEKWFRRITAIIGSH